MVLFVHDLVLFLSESGPLFRIRQKRSGSGKKKFRIRPDRGALYEWSACLHVSAACVGEADGEVDEAGNHRPGGVHSESVHDDPD